MTGVGIGYPQRPDLCLFGISCALLSCLKSHVWMIHARMATGCKFYLSKLGKSHDIAGSIDPLVKGEGNLALLLGVEGPEGSGSALQE